MTDTVTIKRPDAPQHYMVLRPIDGRIVVRLPNGEKIADSTRATRLLECGHTLYDPVAYLPLEDVSAKLDIEPGTTHCPLKGDACYFSLSANGEIQEKIAWSYRSPLDFSMPIKGLVAFYANRVIIEEHPA